MSIIQTKIFKESVETPVLRVNEIECNFVPDKESEVREGKYLPIFDITDEMSGTWYPIEKENKLINTQTGVDNVAFRYAEICNTGNHEIPQYAKIVRIIQPMREGNTGDVTIGIPCYMVLFGSSQGTTDKFFLGKSINSNKQETDGDDLVWYFDNISWTNGTNAYDKLYISLVEVPYEHNPETGDFILDDNNNLIEVDFATAYGDSGPTLPTISYIPQMTSSGKEYPFIKMGSRGKRDNGNSCKILQSNKQGTETDAFVNVTVDFTIIYTENQEQPAIVPHKDNSQVHLTPSEKTEIMSVPLAIDDFRTEIDKFEEFLYGEPTFIKLFSTKTIFNKPRDGNAARIHFFNLKCEDYVGRFLSSITIPHPAIAWESQDIAHNKPVWLFGQCLDSDGNVVKTVVSSNTAQQLGEANVIGETTWNFNPFLIDESFDTIKFGISENEIPIDTDINPPNRTHAIKCYTYDNVLWGVVDQANTEISDDVLNFSFETFIRNNQNIRGHIEDSSIHLTADDKTEISKIAPLKTLVDSHIGDSTHLTETQKTEIGKVGTLEASLNTHVGDDDIHVTAEDKERWNNLTVELNPGSCIEIGENNTISVKTADALAYDENTVPTNKTVYLEMGYVLTDAQTYADEAVTGHRNQSGLHTSTLLQNKWNGHVDNGTIHVTADEKEQLNSILSTIPNEKIRNTKDIFAKDGTGSAARIHAWDLKTADYVGEYLTQATIYRPTNIAYIESSDILHNNPQWLSVECLDADGNLLDTYFSNDKDSQKDGEDNTTTWNFDEIKIKEEYHKLRFRVTTQENVLENQPQSMKRAILCYTYTNIPDTNDWGLIEQNNTVQAGHTMYFQFKTIIKKLSIEGHIENDEIHVTADDKERWNSLVERIAALEARISELENS